MNCLNSIALSLLLPLAPPAAEPPPQRDIVLAVHAQPMPPPARPATVLSVEGPTRVKLGDKLILRSDSSLKHVSWDVPLDAERYEKFGNAVAIWPSRAQSIRVVVTAALTDEAGKFTGFKQVIHIVQVEGGTVPGDPPKPDPPKPGDYLGELRAVIKALVETEIPQTNRVVDARQFAIRYVLTAATPTNDTIAKIQSAQLSANKAVLDTLGSRRGPWQTLLAGPITDELKRLGAAGKLSTVDNVRAAWLAIAAGLGEVQ